MLSSHALSSPALSGLALSSPALSNLALSNPVIKNTRLLVFLLSHRPEVQKQLDELDAAWTDVSKAVDERDAALEEALDKSSKFQVSADPDD